MTLREAVPWVAAAYILVWVVILAYVWIIGRKLNRLERALDELEAQQQQPGTPDA
jgi:CcmD family protein